MRTTKTKGTTTYRDFPLRRTQRETAEAIYQYLLDHPEELPNDADIHHLTFRIDGGEPCVQFSTLTPGTLSVFPATTTQTQVDRGWAANWMNSTTRGVIIPAPQPREDPTPEVRSAAIYRIRLVVRRALRNQAR